MKKIHNKFGISLVLGKGNWIGFSYEIEENNKEIRGLGGKKFKKINNLHIRIWIFKKLLIFLKQDGLKIILGFSDYFKFNI